MTPTPARGDGMCADRHGTMPARDLPVPLWVWVVIRGRLV